MRRLPIYFLIDVSESMVGDPAEQMREGMAAIVRELRTDPYALETVWIAIVAFAGKAVKIVPFIETYNFYPPKIPIGGGTSLGTALEFLMNDIDDSVRKSTVEEKGDWKPIVFLFTDGNPTDDYENAMARWNRMYRRGVNLVVVLLDENVDAGIFGKITDEVLRLENTDSDSFKKFFKWVTDSIKTSSMSVNESGIDGVCQAPIRDLALSKIDLAKTSRVKTDDNFAVILAKCQITKRHYLIKYKRRIRTSEYADGMKTLDYKLTGAYPIDDSYFELSDDSHGETKINTGSLVGFPACPCCGNQFGFSFCSCGKVICSGEEEITKCPWCGVEARFELGDGNADISRTKG